MNDCIRITCRVADTLPLESVSEFQGGLKKRGKKEIEQIITSILKFGFSFPFFVWSDGTANRCLDGHGRILALRLMAKTMYRLSDDGKLVAGRENPPPLPELPVVFVEAGNEAEARQKMLRLNSHYGAIDPDGFRSFVDGLDLDWEELALPDGGLFDLSEAFGGGGRTLSLAERFVVPPLSVFRTASGYWQDRKKAWISLGIRSENGRDDGMLESMAKLAKKASGANLPSESIFDPVLCEIMYRWFCPPGGMVLDPFAGGSVRGIVAGCLDRDYTGLELRREQVDANLEQAGIAGNRPPEWICADSREMDAILPADFACDFVFSCPPYADLEVYSKLDEDLSNMDYPDFRAAYREIVAKACSRLREDSFAAFVVGEARNKKGRYHGLVPDTVRAFEDAGLGFYDEMILVTQIAAKALTVAEGFVKSRKIGKVHQNVLVFVKGDPARAAEKCKIDADEIAGAMRAAEKGEEVSA